MSAVALRSPRELHRPRLRTIVTTAITLAAVAVWMVALRPQAFGGPTSIVVVSGTSMEPSLRTGDLVLVRRQESYRVGDVIAYRIPEGGVGAGSVIIHRIRAGSAARGFVVRGDNRSTDDQWRPRPADVMGARWVDVATSNRVVKMVFSPVGVAAMGAAVAFVLVAMGGGERRRGDSSP